MQVLTALLCLELRLFVISRKPECVMNVGNEVVIEWREIMADSLKKGMQGAFKSTKKAALHIFALREEM
jgi:hypothetical protein